MLVRCLSELESVSKKTGLACLCAALQDRSLYPGKDSKSRVARIKISASSMLRPIQRLVPLEVSSEESDDVNLDDTSIVVGVAANEEPMAVSHQPPRQIRRPVGLDL